MLTIPHKLSLVTAGVAALTLGTLAPANAFQLNVFQISGTTGCLDSHYYPEYQGASFTGFFSVRNDAPDLNPDPYKGLFEVYDFKLTLTNSYYPEFTSVISLNSTQPSYITIGSLGLGIEADIENSSQDDPTKALYQLFFSGSVGDPNRAPTQAPDSSTFVPHLSFLNLSGALSGAPEQTVPIVTAKISHPTFQNTEAVPEPTTMAGMGVFGLGLLLKRVSRKKVA